MPFSAGVSRSWTKAACKLLSTRLLLALPIRILRLASATRFSSQTCIWHQDRLGHGKQCFVFRGLENILPFSALVAVEPAFLANAQVAQYMVTKLQKDLFVLDDAGGEGCSEKMIDVLLRLVKILLTQLLYWYIRFLSSWYFNKLEVILLDLSWECYRAPSKSAFPAFATLTTVKDRSAPIKCFQSYQSNQF